MLHVLNDRLWFPDPEEATEDGLLAIGGDLSTERLLLAYSSGIFPWYDPDELPMWWCPDPRFVLFPRELRISKSMKQLLKQDYFEFTVNKDFSAVIAHCRTVARKDQPGTWIGEAVIDAYTTLHEMGYAWSAEAWKDGELAGGLYGVRMENCFFGESMFARSSNASKYAFIKLVQQLQAAGVLIIDCQVYTPHLESLGGRMIPRKDFLNLLRQALAV